MRTNIDWSKHIVKVRQEGSFTIHHIGKPNSSVDNVKFINGEGILCVTGDYGNWIFSRSFVPSSDGRVSDGYWLDKLKNSSSQEPYEFDSEETEKDILLFLSEFKADNPDWDEIEKQKEVIEYYEDLLRLVDNYYDYQSRAGDYPSYINAEDIIYRKKPKYWILAVFDAFEEICKRS